MYIDAHCHLEAETYAAELPDVIARAEAIGMSHFIAVGATRGVLGAQEAVALAEQRANVFATCGIHPHDALQATEANVELIAQLAKHPKVVGIGEIGLDYYYDNSPKEVQQSVFKTFLRLAQTLDLPVMLHIRDAHADCWQILDEVGLPRRGGMVHCFTAGPDEAKEYLARGMYLSIPGVITFKNADPLRAAVAETPLDRLFIETDSPYLAPIPYRGKRNEPSYIVKTAEAIGMLKGLSAAQVGEATSKNTSDFFRLRQTR